MNCCIVPSVDSWRLKENKIKAKYSQQARGCKVEVLERCAVHVVWDAVHGEHSDKPPRYSFDSAHRHMSLPDPTIVIGDLNAAPTADNHKGPATATDLAPHAPQPLDASTRHHT